MRNKYGGWKVPVNKKNKQVDAVPVEELDTQRLWSQYISQRKPVLIQGHLSDPGWTASHKWTNAYLAQKAGSSQLMVEVRDDPNSSFGAGRKQAMGFKDFLDRMGQGDEALYLTTQAVPAASDGHPALWGQPLAHLTQDFVVQPQLMGALVPQQLNLWMGCARSGSSSGLHHDFHDNLYVLLRGRKRFRLWDPSRAAAMHTKGVVKLVHGNGRIVYDGQGDVLADGSSEKEAAAWAARAAAEARVAAAEAAVQQGAKGSADQLVAAEAALDQLLDAQLEAAIDAGGSQGGSDDWGDLQDDYVGDESDAASPDDEDSEGDSEKSDQGDDADVKASGQRRGLGQAPSKSHKSKKDRPKPGSKPVVTQDAEDPPSFCTGVDLSLSDAELAKRFPGFPGKASMLEVWVSAGQMLYLPAGWFHEVTSFNAGDEQEEAGGQGRAAGRAAGLPDQGGHMAFNYWFHPPDHLDASPAGAAQPYKSGYWPAIWQARCKSMARAVSPQSILVRRDSFEQVKVDEADGALGHDPHRGPLHSFSGVKVDEVDGATGHDPHRGPGHHFDNVKVDEKDGALGHDPHRGPRHSFDGVRVDEVDGGTGHDAHHVKQQGPAAASVVEMLVVEQGGVVLGGAVGKKSSRKSGKPQRNAEHTVAASGSGAGVVGLQRWVPEEEEEEQEEAGGLEAMEVEPAGVSRKRGSKASKVEQTSEDGVTGKKRGRKGVNEEEEEEQPSKQAKAKGKMKQQQAAAEEEGEEEEGLLEAEDGDMGEMVAKELGEYFASQEGAGAFRLALGKYLLEAMAKEQAESMKRRRRGPRQVGSRHHRVVRVPHGDRPGDD